MEPGGHLRVLCNGERSGAGAIKEAQLESMSGEEAYERANTSHVPAPDAARFPSQFEFGRDDKHNWVGRNDERIKLAVMTALHWDLAVPRDRVQVSVHRGWVTLTGRVMREYEKDRAEADARMTAGVAGVVNRLACEAGN
jgi:osmotically-inducible protein OsmY